MTTTYPGRPKLAALTTKWTVITLTLIWAGVLHGQIVAWDVNGKTASANNPLAAAVLDGYFSSASLTLGGGITASATANTFGGSGFDQTSLAGAISGSDFISFTITPASGANFDLQSMGLLFGVSSAVTNFNLALTTNISGFTSGGELWTYSFSTASPAAQTIALTGFGFLQDAATPIEFRLYGWRDLAGTTTFRIRDNAGYDLSLAGSASAIPEPSTYAALIGSAGMMVAICRRRKKPLV